MNHTQTLPHRRLPSITVMAAVVAVLIFGVLLLVMNTPKRPDLGSGILADTTDGETSTPMTYISTPTPPPTHMMLTPTVLPPSMQFDVMFANAIPLTVGQTVEGVLSAEKSVQAYTFTTEEDLIVRIRLESDDLGALVLNMGARYTDAASGASGMGGGPAAQFSFLPLQSGAEAIIAVIGPDRQPHRFTLSTQVADFTHTAYGEAVQDTLAENTPYLLYAFEATAGDIITARVDSDEVDTRLSLLGQTGGPMITDEDGGAGFNPEILEFLLPRTETYYMLVEASHPSESGAFTFSVELVDHQPIPTLEPISAMADRHVPIELGEAVTGDLSAETQMLSYELTIEEAGTLAVFAYGEGFYPRLSHLIMTEDNGGGGGGGGGSGGGPQYTGVVEFYAVPADSTVVITVQGDYGIPGDFILSVKLLNAFPVAVYGETVETELAPFTLFAFEAEAGDTVNLSIDGGEVDTYARLLNSMGAPMAEDNDSGAGLNPEMRGIYLPEAGIYYVHVQALDGEMGGPVALSLALSDELDVYPTPTPTEVPPPADGP